MSDLSRRRFLGLLPAAAVAAVAGNLIYGREKARRLAASDLDAMLERAWSARDGLCASGADIEGVGFYESAFGMHAVARPRATGVLHTITPQESPFLRAGATQMELIPRPTYEWSA